MHAVAIDDSEAVYSPEFTVSDAPVWALQHEWTGNPTAVVSLWASCKRYPDPSDDSDWVEIDDFDAPTLGGEAGKALSNVGNSAAKWYRLKIVVSGGSGTYSLWVHSKASRG